MPAARRYKQSHVDRIKEAIRALPAGEPPEPEVTTDEALAQWTDELRRKLDEYVDMAVLVDLLNAQGFKVNARQVHKAVKGKAAKPRKASRAKRPSARTRENKAGKDGPVAKESKGSFEVRPDSDDI